MKEEDPVANPLIYLPKPDGSVFKKLGIDSVSDQTGLTTFIDIVINKKYKTPKMISEISNFKDVNYLNI